MPPHLAGREPEQALIRGHLNRLEGKWSTGRDVIIYGPRGNGKTALMEWALRQAESRKIGIMDFSSEEIKSAEWLAEHLSILPRWLRSLRGLSAMGFGMQTSDSPAGRISGALGRRARRRGLVIAIDEAHTLATDAGRALLHAVQRLGRKELPVMLILAGTPDLPRHLNTMESSFWDRSEVLPLGLLRPSAASDAIRIPMEAGGRSIAADALAQVVAESHGYPYFLQLWGRLLWTEIKDVSLPASLEDVDRIRSRFKRERNIYYGNRYGELNRAKLARVAAKLSLAFIDTDTLTDLEVEATIGQALESEGRAADADAVMTAFDLLYDLGYIWPVQGESRAYLQPGIPSLMEFVAASMDMDSEPNLDGPTTRP